MATLGKDSRTPDRYKNPGPPECEERVLISFLVLQPLLGQLRRCEEMEYQQEEYYRVRSFSITPNGIFNLGDSFKSRRSRSVNSVSSTGSSHSDVSLPPRERLPRYAAQSVRCGHFSRVRARISQPYKSSHLAGYCSGNALHLYSGYVSLEFQPEHRLSWQVSVAFLSPSRQV
jgi:hypothetical protein